jgi:histidyl-tRNA synthetase
VEWALGGQKLARQLKAADAAGARLALLVSTADAGRGEATVRDLRAGSEERVTVDRWIDAQ